MKQPIWQIFRYCLGAVLCGLLLLSTAAPASGQEPRPFVDLQPGEQPTDGAVATVQLIQSGGATLASLHITALRDGFEGVELRSSLFDGDCASFGTAVDQAMLDVTIGSSSTLTTGARIPLVLTPNEARVLVVHDLASGDPWACVEIPWPTQDMLDAQAREAATNQPQFEGLAHTGSDSPSLLAVMGGTLVLGGLLFLSSASFSRRIEDGSV